MENNKKMKKNIIIVILLVFLLFFVSPIKNIRIKILNEIFFPVKQFIYKSSFKLKKTVFDIKNIKKIIIQNQELKSQNQKFKIEISKLFQDVQDIKNIKKNEQNKLKQYKLITAKVIYMNPSQIFTKFVINKGEKDGIKTNMPVISANRLIGKISDVKLNRSTVTMITAFDSNVGAISSDSQNFGIAMGQNSRFMTMQFLYSVSDVKVSDELTTAGIAHIFPKGLFVGKVLKITKVEKPQLKETVYLDTKINPMNLNYIFVIAGKF